MKYLRCRLYNIPKKNTACFSNLAGRNTFPTFKNFDKYFYQS